jgi:hypothetical protein
MIKYKLLSTSKGIILDRTPKKNVKTVGLKFDIYDKDATVIFGFEDGTNSYKPIEDGICKLSLEGKEGSIAISVAILNGDANPKKWVCEALKVIPLPEGKYIVIPDDQDVRQLVADLCLENETIRGQFSALTKDVKNLSDKLDALMDGYDLI